MILSHIFAFIFLALAHARSPTNDYAPGQVTCPRNAKFLRNGTSISENEKNWIENRHKKTDRALLEFLDNIELDDFDAEEFLSNATRSPNIGLAFSGGGYRAMLSGAGQLAALDNRTNDVNDTVGLGGIFQSASYITGLSGGGWLVGSLAMQNFPTIDEVVFDNPSTLWNLTEDKSLVKRVSVVSIILPALFGNVEKLFTAATNWAGPDGISNDINEKKRAGFVTSITDTWGRGLAHQLFPKGRNNFMSASTWSDVTNSSVFRNHEVPFPILTALARKPTSVEYDLNSTVVELNPFEMGSFEPAINSFFDTKYIGTRVANGKPLNGTCIQGFDNAAFVVGTTSSLFNQFLNTLVCDDCHQLNFFYKAALKRILNRFSTTYYDIATYKPNPFFRSEYADSDSLTKNETLYLMDGGLGGETLPLSSLMTKERKLDTVFAFDNSEQWPNGSALVNTYRRQFSRAGQSTICPYVPGESTFQEHNLTAKPTFFGCDARNLTKLEKSDVVPPLVIYIANRPWEFWSNTSTFKMQYTDREKKGMIRNGFDVATRLNNTIDDEWQACVACAVIRREQERQGVEQSDQCKSCFKRYCWDGSTHDVEGSYYRNVNFTKTGLTNDSMTLWTTPTDEYISPISTGSTNSLISILKRDAKQISGAKSLTPRSALPWIMSTTFLVILFQF